MDGDQAHLPVPPRSFEISGFIGISLSLGECGGLAAIPTVRPVRAKSEEGGWTVAACGKRPCRDRLPVARVFTHREAGSCARNELIRRFSAVERALREGKLCLSSVVELAKVLTPENEAKVLPRFFGLSSREAAFVATSIRPVEDPPVRDVAASLPALSSGPARALPVATPPLPRTRGDAPAAEVRAHEALPATIDGPAPSAPRLARAAVPEDDAEPLDAERVRLHITVTRRLLAKIEALKDDLARGGPGLTAEEVIEACIDRVLAERDERRGLVATPRAAPVRPLKTDAVPAHVKRAVWQRAAGRCEWVLESGERCGCATRLELDHVTPRARGGPSTIDNVRAICRPHNDLSARLAFGDRWMDKFTRKRGRSDGAVAPAP